MKIIKSITQKLKEYKDISYILPIMISTLFAITQILSYYFRIGYLSYFDISKEFYNFNLFNDLMPIIMNFFTISIIIIITLINACIMNYFFENIFNGILDNVDSSIKNLAVLIALIFKNAQKSFRKYYTFKSVILGIIGLYILILVSLGTFSTIMYGSIYNVFSNSNFLFFISLIISLIYTILKYKNKKSKVAKSKENENHTISVTTYLLELILFVIMMFALFLDLGTSAAKGQREFNIIDNKYVILYNSNDKYLVADFNYVESNSIIINTQNIKSIDLNNCSIKKQTFKEVFKE